MNLQDVLNNAQQEADADAAAKGSGGYINAADLKVGEHKVRLFLDPTQAMFHKWKTKWAGKGHQADPRQFKECPEGLASRITNGLAAGYELPKPNEFYKNDFWENLYAYMLIVETDVKDNKYFKAGKVYCVSMPYYVRDAILAAITKAYSKPQFKEEMEQSLDITKEGIVLEITIKKDKKAMCFADVGGTPIAAPDMSDYKEGQFRPLNEFYAYNEEAGLKFAEEIETGLEELRAKLADKEEAQSPPEDDAPASTEATPAATTEAPAEGAKAGGKPF